MRFWPDRGGGGKWGGRGDETRRDEVEGELHRAACEARNLGMQGRVDRPASR